MSETTPRRRRTRPLRAGDILPEPVPARPALDPPALAGSETDVPALEAAPVAPSASVPALRQVAAVPASLPTIDQVAAAVPGVFRLGVAAAAHVTEWTVQNTVDNTVHAMKQVADGEPTTKVVGDLVRRVRWQAGSLFSPGRSTNAPTQGVERPAESVLNPGPDDRDGSDSLRRRGSELMRRSADVAATEETHPAYARILDEVAPDEARILRMFYEDGAQPSVDIRAGGVLPISSDLVAAGLSMIGNLSGARHPERVPRYLNNLQRLGLIWFSREPVADVSSYQVLEAQPEVIDTIASVKRGKTVRRSIHLTPFGADFCEVCLPVGDRHPSATGS